MESLKNKYTSLINWSTSLYNQKLLVFLLVGLILIGFGVLMYRVDAFSSGDKVEVLPASPSDGSQGGNGLEITVEAAGAVEKVGVYKLPAGSRIDDLLISAGGLSAEADREWVEKYINKASKLVDGQKIYIWHLGEQSAKNTSDIKLDQQVLGVSGSDPSTVVNINTASQSELEKLNGIGPVYATKIIEQRPYSNLQELVTKGAIKQNLFEKIKNEITL